jgi:hypothetical protein
MSVYGELAGKAAKGVTDGFTILFVIIIVLIILVLALASIALYFYCH